MKEKTASQIFLELGYKSIRNDEHWSIYRGKEKDIDFNKKNKSVEVEDEMESRPISMQELKAINKKVKELGWNE